MKPPLRGHHRDQEKSPLKRGVPLIEVHIIIIHYSAKAISRKLERYKSFIIQHIDKKTKFEEKILSTSFLFLHSLVKMLKFTSIVGYTSCGPTYIESFFTIFGQCINVLNYNKDYMSVLPAGTRRSVPLILGGVPKKGSTVVHLRF